MDKLKLPRVPLKMVLLGLLGVALLLAGNTLSTQRPPTRTLESRQPASLQTSEEASLLRSYQSSLAAEAERVISQIKGAGKVVVSVTTGGGPESVIASSRTQNSRRTEEKDRSGVARVVEEQTDSAQPVIARQSSAGDKPVVTRVAAPKVDGVLVVAQGAQDPRVRAEIFHAVQVLFNVPAHRVKVLAMKVGE